MLRIQIVYRGEQNELEHASGPFEFGRGPARDGIVRFVTSDSYVSANHMRLEQIGEDVISVKNLSTRNNIRLNEKDSIPVGEGAQLFLPATFMVGETLLRIEKVAQESPMGPMDSLDVNSTLLAKSDSPSLFELGGSPSPEKLAQWLETLLAVQRSAAGSLQFYQESAKALVELIGLDRGLILMLRNGRWMVQARFPDEDVDHREFSAAVLQKMSTERKTIFQSGTALQVQSESVMELEAVIASPIFDARENIVGAVYGIRNKHQKSGTKDLGITPLEAQVVQLLASSVGIGLARQEQEAEASRLKVQFDQFFSADLARELQKNPKLLDGVETEVTVLFVDIRGFSRISEKMNPSETCRLVSDVMEELTNCVHNQDGVVVDYAGDGLMAMWNAPARQEDHAAKACKSALAMLERMPLVQERWKTKIEGVLKIGVGINTGMALCGNTGSKVKFKYGPLGHTVNLGSRIEGATKYLGVPILISGYTRRQISESFATRRIRSVKVVGINEPVDLYQVHAVSKNQPWMEFAETYERALKEFESGRFGEASKLLYPLISGKDGEYDVPSLGLMARTIQYMRSVPPEGFCGIEELESK